MKTFYCYSCYRILWTTSTERVYSKDKRLDSVAINKRVSLVFGLFSSALPDINTVSCSCYAEYCSPEKLVTGESYVSDVYITSSSRSNSKSSDARLTALPGGTAPNGWIAATANIASHILNNEWIQVLLYKLSMSGSRYGYYFYQVCSVRGALVLLKCILICFKTFTAVSSKCY